MSTITKKVLNMGVKIRPKRKVQTLKKVKKYKPKNKQDFSLLHTIMKRIKQE